MHQHSDTQVEITSQFHVWYHNDQEIGAYRTANAAEAHIRRALKAGWGERSLLMVDKDGSVLELGIPTGHKIVTETRNAINGI